MITEVDIGVIECPEHLYDIADEPVVFAVGFSTDRYSVAYSIPAPRYRYSEYVFKSMCRCSVCVCVRPTERQKRSSVILFMSF